MISARLFRRFCVRTFLALPLAAIAAEASAAPTAADALKLAPVQRGVEYDFAQPDAAQTAQCTIKAEKMGSATAWVVRGPDGAVLRQFSDANGDNVVDTWAYFHGGMEVYRDIDANFNGKADQYRWFNMAGSRWALDQNEDGTIDAWKIISAEEASEEAIAALAARDARRFQRLLLSKEDVAALGLSKQLAGELAQRLSAAPKTFADLAGGGKIDAKAEFTDFGGQRPGMVPAGASGLTRDLLVYEDAWAMVLSGEEHHQLQLGTMVQVGNTWKFVDGPILGGGEQVARGFFYDADGGASPEAPSMAISQPTSEMQKILEQIEVVDKEIMTASAEKKPELNAQRADLLEKLSAAAETPAEKEQWLKQLADTISAAVQEGSYPDGLERLTKLEEKLVADKADEDLIIHIQFRRMQAAYGLAVADPKNSAKAQADWLEQLEKFVDEHKSSEHVAEALYQLAMASEFAGEADAAQKWYDRLVKDFPQSANAVKARGAIVRLNCKGKPISLKGSALTGGTADLAQYKGKAVLIQYWTTSAPTCENDHKQLLEIYRKYGGAKFDVIGVCLDHDREAASEYLKNHRLPWKQIYEPGGFESRLAKEMGVITAPLLILVDQKGQGVSNSVELAELEEELKELIPSQVASAKQ